MWNRTRSRSTTLQFAAAVLSMLLSLAVAAGAAGAQSLPGTDALPSGGTGITTGPGGIQVGVETPATGGVNVGIGPNGVELGQGTTPPTQGTSPPAAEPGRAVSPTPSAPSSGGTTPAPSDRADRSPQDGGSGTGNRSARAARNRAGGAQGSDRRTRSPRTAVVGDLRPAARSERDSKGGIAPVFDLVERIPAAVRAGLVALALIALAMWGLWVRGRRRLQRNAYLDPDTGVANMAAFEEMLEREWTRAARFRRPLGLLLLEVEQRGAGGIPLLGQREALDAVQHIAQEVRASDIVARLAPSRFAIICPEAPQGSGETIAHAVELRLEERRLRCWTGFAERREDDARPADLVSRAATRLADAQAEPRDEAALHEREYETVAFPQAGGVAAA
jgi:diguanylate cyclase (GGDEF)-like protein